jgi:hypothetical protein
MTVRFIPLSVFLLVSGVAHAETAFSPDAGLTPLSEAEMDRMHGGFSTPAGLEIAVGLDLVASISPQMPNSAPNVPPGLVASASLAQVNGSPALISLVQYSSMGIDTVLQNSLNNVTVGQVTQLNVDVANYSRIQAQWQALSPLISDRVSGLPH